MAWLRNLRDKLDKRSSVEAILGASARRLDIVLREEPEKSTSEWSVLYEAVFEKPNLVSRATGPKGLRHQLISILLEHGASVAGRDLELACRTFSAEVIEAYFEHASRHPETNLTQIDPEKTYFGIVWHEASLAIHRGLGTPSVVPCLKALKSGGCDINQPTRYGATFADEINLDGAWAQEVQDWAEANGALLSTDPDIVEAVRAHPSQWFVPSARDFLRAEGLVAQQPMPHNMVPFLEHGADPDGFVLGVEALPQIKQAAWVEISRFAEIAALLADTLKAISDCDTKHIAVVLENRIWALCDDCGSAVRGDAFLTLAGLQNAGHVVVGDPAMARLVSGQCAHCEAHNMILCWVGGRR